MPIPTDVNLNTLNFVFEGEVFNDASPVSTIETITLDYVVGGEVFVGNLGETASVLVQQTESADITDVVNVGAATIPEEVAATDEGVANIKIAVDDPLASTDVNVVDASNTFATKDEPVEATDETRISIVRSETEVVAATDEVVPIYGLDEPLPSQDEVEYFLDLTLSDTVKIEISHLYSESDTVLIDISQPVFQPVTDYADPTNPFEPTIIINNTVVASNPSTVPPATVAAQVYLNFKMEGIFSGSTCNVISFNLNLNRQGGTWQVVTKDFPYAGNGLCGLIGTVVAEGDELGQYGRVYISEGIFGNPVLNRPLLLYSQAPTLGNLMYTQYLQSPPSSQWSTIQAAARAVAEAAGVTLAWACKDTTLVDLGPESSMTVGSALDSLGSRVKSSLLWDGSFGYYMAPPNFTIGGWSVPNCALLTRNGMRTMNQKDLKSYQAVFMPVDTIAGGQATFESYKDRTKATPILYPTETEKVISMGSLGKKLEAEDPTKYIQLEPGYKTVKYQIVTKTDSSGSGVVLENNAKTWDNFPGSIEKRPDGTHWAAITSAHMPSNNTDVDANNFSFNVGIVRNNDAEIANFKKSANEVIAGQRFMAAMQQEALRYVTTSTGSISCYFFGSLPLPGMFATASFDGVTVMGIVESVSLTMPGILNVQLSNYVELHFYQPRPGMQVLNAAVGNIS